MDVVPHRIMGKIVVIFPKNSLYTQLYIVPHSGLFIYPKQPRVSFIAPFVPLPPFPRREAWIFAKPSAVNRSPKVRPFWWHEGWRGGGVKTMNPP